MCVGISAINIEMTTWKKVLISLVTNVNGKTFWLLHSMSQVGEPYIEKVTFTPPKSNNEMSFEEFRNSMLQDDENYDYYENYYDGWSNQDIESGLADAFEDDPDALWNID